MSSVSASSQVPTPSAARPRLVTESARSTVACGISRPNACARWRPRRLDITTMMLTMKAPILIPPAVEVEAPPMNIIPSNTVVVALCSCEMSTVAMPVVRLTERKTELTSTSSGPSPSSVRPDCTSPSANSAVPINSRENMPSATSRVSSVQKRGRRRMLNTVRKERLPRKAATLITAIG